ncbi:hypothetical protein [Pyrinomonas sp.]|mgnify:CR=1 FL=1|uniref:hypothetical protein n=1 Tax=Pyrinomonas sp. TaxID=2080306 RepID=UPI003332636A
MAFDAIEMLFGRVCGLVPAFDLGAGSQPAMYRSACEHDRAHYLNAAWPAGVDKEAMNERRVWRVAFITEERERR